MDVAVGRVGQEVGFGSRNTFYEAWERVTGEKLKDLERRSAEPEIEYPAWRRWLRGEMTVAEAQRVLAVVENRYPQIRQPSGAGRRPRIVIDGAAYERFEAERVWTSVRGRPFEEQRQIVRGYLFHSEALFDLLRKKSREEGRQDRNRGVELARLALVSLEEHEEVLGDRIHDLRALGWTWLANAWRLEHDFERSEKNFERAEAEWLFPRARQDLRVLAEIHFYRSALRLDQRRFQESLALASESLDLSRQLSDNRLEVQALTARSSANCYLDELEAAIADLRTAAEVVHEEQEPYLVFGIHASIAYFAIRSDHFEVAAQHARRALKYAEGFEDPGPLYQVWWIQALINEAIGDTSLAAKQAHLERSRP
jgi:tetratricopeptide (TPR) repeat protein